VRHHDDLPEAHSRSQSIRHFPALPSTLLSFPTGSPLGVAATHFVFSFAGCVCRCRVLAVHVCCRLVLPTVIPLCMVSTWAPRSMLRPLPVVSVVSAPLPPFCWPSHLITFRQLFTANMVKWLPKLLLYLFSSLSAHACVSMHDRELPALERPNSVFVCLDTSFSSHPRITHIPCCPPYHRDAPSTQPISSPVSHQPYAALLRYGAAAP